MLVLALFGLFAIFFNNCSGGMGAASGGGGGASGGLSPSNMMLAQVANAGSSAPSVMSTINNNLADFANNFTTDFANNYYTMGYANKNSFTINKYAQASQRLIIVWL